MPTPDRCIRGPLRIAVLARSLVSVLLHNLPSLLGAEVAQLSKLVLSVLSAVFCGNPSIKRNPELLFVCHGAHNAPGRLRSQEKSAHKLLFLCIDCRKG